MAPDVAYNEADTRAKLIDPAIYKRGWSEDFIRREQSAGSIEIIGGKARRRAKGKVDYLLRIKVNPKTQPVAVALIEAKKNTLPPGHGLDQAKGYAECGRLNVPFVFSSNGYQFVEFDCLTGQTSPPRLLSEFPTPDELRTRYEQHKGFSLENEAAKPLLTPYTGGEGTRRYYQDAAIRAVMEKIVQCEVQQKPKRALLSLATGSGKTFIAVNLLKRISDAGQLKRALFVCDRDELRTQALKAFHNVFGSDAAEVYKDSDGKNHARNARVHVATYQTLGVAKDDDDTSFLTTFYPENYFSHIIIDECHRSAWGKWSQVLTRNSEAVQVGLTATPRELECKENTQEAQADQEITANNLKYFGPAVYEYTITQAQNDGYLAACEIQKGRVNLDETGISKEQILARHPVDAITGLPIMAEIIDELYEKYEYENKIMLPDRVIVMCRDLFQYLLDTGGPEQKTVIFCARDRHADAVAVEMNNLYARWCEKNGRERLPFYAFKCTAAASGNDQLPDLRASTRSHFIATTVELLSTGVDVPCLQNISFFKYMKSPISFYQMIGRGTRIDLPTKKLMFRVYDYTDATRLFGEAFLTRARGTGGSGPGPQPPPPPEPVISVEGFDVHITDDGRFIVGEVDGQAMPIPVEEYKQRLAERLLSQAHTLEEFRSLWVDPPSRRELIDTLIRGGCSPNIVRLVDEKENYDYYDILAELGWGAFPRTMHDRACAFIYKQEDWLNSLPPQASATIRAIAFQFEQGGTDGLENPHIFNTPEVKNAGGIAALKEAGNPAQILKETKNRMFAA